MCTQATTDMETNEFVENKLEGLKATLEHVVSTKQRLQGAMRDLEQVEKEIEIMVGNPLTLSYGYAQNLNNGGRHSN